jgi:peroxiredoxin
MIAMKPNATLPLSRRKLGLTAGIVFAAALTAGALVASHAAAQATIGGPAPAFTAVDSNGKTHRLADFRGKTVVLEWTNHQCPFVVKHYETGNMQRLQREATRDGVVWLSIISSAPGQQGHVSAADANRLTRERNAAPTAKLLDPTGAVGRAYGARTTPHMYVINAQGQLVYAGAIDNNPGRGADTVSGATNYVSQALAEVKAGKPVSRPVTQAYGCSVKYATS